MWPTKQPVITYSIKMPIVCPILALLFAEKKLDRFVTSRCRNGIESTSSDHRDNSPAVDRSPLGISPARDFTSDVECAQFLDDDDRATSTQFSDFCSDSSNYRVKCLPVERRNSVQDAGDIALRRDREKHYLEKDISVCTDVTADVVSEPFAAVATDQNCNELLPNDPDFCVTNCDDDCFDGGIQDNNPMPLSLSTSYTSGDRMSDSQQSEDAYGIASSTCDTSTIITVCYYDLGSCNKAILFHYFS